MIDRTAWDRVLKYAAYVLITVAGLLILFGGLTYLDALRHGQTSVPEVIKTQFINFALLTLTAAGVVVNGFIQAKRSDRNATITHLRLSETERKLTDGLGDKLADKVADKVSAEAAKVAEQLSRPAAPWDGNDRRKEQ